MRDCGGHLPKGGQFTRLNQFILRAAQFGLGLAAFGDFLFKTCVKRLNAGKFHGFALGCQFQFTFAQEQHNQDDQSRPDQGDQHDACASLCDIVHRSQIKQIPFTAADRFDVKQEAFITDFKQAILARRIFSNVQ